MSLGYGVVQLDVTIVNTAMPAIGSSLEANIAELQAHGIKGYIATRHAKHPVILSARSADRQAMR